MPARLAVFLLAAFALLAAPAAAQTQPAPPWIETGPEVDVALVLAVDISYSMDLEEQALQREGYVAALTSPAVIDAIRKGMVGRIAVTYLEWAGVATRNIVVDWTIIEDERSARGFADQLKAAPIRRARRTSLSNAIDFSMDRLHATNLRAIRRVIDISGDGPNNEGAPVTRARDRALAAGVIINGLPVVLDRGYRSSFDIEGLDEYFEDCVIGGPGAFMIAVVDRAQFADAIRAKILREVAQNGLSDLPAAPRGRARADCLIGEKLWRQNWERN
jgi:hypothetical protein